MVGRILALMTAVWLVAAACADADGDAVATTTEATTTTAAPGTTTAPPAPDEEPGSEAIEREVWKYLGEVVPGEEYGGLADFKVGRFGDGTYIGIAHRGVAHTAEGQFGGGGGSIVFTSTNLVDWEFVYEIGPADTWFNEGFHGGYITLDDGRVRMYWVETISLGGGAFMTGIASATTADGITWERDPGHRLTDDDVDGEVLLENLTVVPRSEGGWRMYVLLRDCTIPNLYGGLNCEEEDPEWGYADLAVFTLVSAVSDDTLHWVMEPGARLQSSFETGSMSQPAAWIDREGRVRLSSTGIPRIVPGDEAPQTRIDPSEGIEQGHPGWSAAGRAALWTYISDDGLDFHTYVEHSGPAPDPNVVSGPDGRMLMFVSPGAGTTRSGIHLFELTTVSWAIDYPVLVDIQHDFEAGGHAILCFAVEFRGEGTFTIEVFGGLSTFSPRLAHPDAYRVDQPVMSAPGTLFIETREWLPDDEPLDPGLNPVHAIATDEDGVRWWLPLYSAAAVMPTGEACDF
jgi:hypothetical protein